MVSFMGSRTMLCIWLGWGFMSIKVALFLSHILQGLYIFWMQI